MSRSRRAKRKAGGKGPAQSGPPADSGREAETGSGWIERLTQLPWALPAALVALTVGVWARSLALPLVYWDDQIYLLEDPRLETFSFANLWEILSTPFLSNYHPVATLTYAVDRAVWGMWLPGFHITQLAFYVTGVVLIYYLFRAILGRDLLAFAAAAIYSVHAIHVESVVWLASRKDVVCLVFYAAAMLAYVRYTQSERRERRLYLASVAFAAGAMLSKGYGVVLPGVLLAYDACFNYRITRRHLLDKIPFLALAAAVTVITFVAQDADSALVHPDLPWWQRLALLFKVLAAYVGRTILPVGLSAKYFVHQGWSNPFVGMIGALLGVGAVVGFFKLRRRAPVGAFAIALFVLPLGTVMNVLFTLRIWMADRYLFLPTIGSSLGLAAMGLWLLEKKPARSMRARALVAVTAGIIALYSGLTVARMSVWSSETAFWSDVLRKQAGLSGSGPLTGRELRTGKVADIEAAVTLAGAYKRAGKAQESQQIIDAIGRLPAGNEAGGGLELAERDIEAGRPDKAIERLRPMAEGGTQHAPVAWTWMGVAYEKKGELETARKAHLKSIQLYDERRRSPVPAMLNLGLMELRENRLDEAGKWFGQARDHAPATDPRPIFYAGMALQKAGKIDQAERLYSEVLQLEGRVPPNVFFEFADVHLKMGNLTQKLGKSEAALEHFADVLHSTPEHPQSAGVHLKMAIIEEQRGRLEASVGHLEKVLTIKPKHPNRHGFVLKMGLLQEQLGRRQEALSLLEECLRLKPDHPQQQGIRQRIRALRQQSSP